MLHLSFFLFWQMVSPAAPGRFSFFDGAAPYSFRCFVFVLVPCCFTRLRHLRATATRKGDSGKSERWFSAFDSAGAAAKRRHLRMLLVDITLILLNASPFNLARNVDFYDNLSAVFQKAGQSLVAAAHILRDDRMFQVRFLMDWFPMYFLGGTLGNSINEGWSDVGA